MYCWRSGLIGHGKSVPEGALAIDVVSGRAQLSRLLTTARLAYDGRSYLVPGVPEAVDDNAALDALVAWREWAVQSPSRRRAREAEENDARAEELALDEATLEYALEDMGRLLTELDNGEVE